MASKDATLSSARSARSKLLRSLPAELRGLRERGGLTQRALALRLHISHVAIHRIETGMRRVELTIFCDWTVACGADPVTALRRLLSKPDYAAPLRQTDAMETRMK